MKIFISGKESTFVYEDFKQKWDDLTTNSEVGFWGQRSASEADSFLQIIGNILEWVFPFKVIITVFISTIVKEAAKDLWAAKSKLVKFISDKDNFKTKAAVELIKEKLVETEKLQFVLTYSHPTNYIEVSLVIKEKDFAEITWSFVSFISNLEKINKIICDEINNNRTPSQLMNLNILENGKLKLSWVDSVELEMHEVIL